MILLIELFLNYIIRDKIMKTKIRKINLTAERSHIIEEYLEEVWMIEVGEGVYVCTQEYCISEQQQWDPEDRLKDFDFGYNQYFVLVTDDTSTDDTSIEGFRTLKGALDYAVDERFQKNLDDGRKEYTLFDAPFAAIL